MTRVKNVSLAAALGTVPRTASCASFSASTGVLVVASPAGPASLPILGATVSAPSSSVSAGCDSEDESGRDSLRVSTDMEDDEVDHEQRERERAYDALEVLDVSFWQRSERAGELVQLPKTLRVRGGEPSACAVAPDGSVAVGTNRGALVIIPRALVLAAPELAEHLEEPVARNEVGESSGAAWLRGRSRYGNGALRAGPQHAAATVAMRAHRGPIRSVTFGSQGDTVITGSDDRTAAVWPVESPLGTPKRLFSHPAPVTDVDVHPRDSTIVVTGCQDGKVRIHPATGNCMTLEAHEAAVTAIRFDPVGSLLASTSVDGTIRVFSIESPVSSSTKTALDAQAVNQYQQRAQLGYYGCAFVGDRIAGVARDGSVEAWGIIDGKRYPLAPPLEDTRALAASVSKSAPSTCPYSLARIRYSPKRADHVLLVRCGGRRISFVSLDGIVGEVRGHGSAIDTIRFGGAQDRNELVLASGADGHVIAFRRNGSSAAVLRGSDPLVSADGSLLALRDGTGTTVVRLDTIRNGCSTAVEKAVAWRLNDAVPLAFSPRERLIALARSEGVLVVHGETGKRDVFLRVQAVLSTDDNDTSNGFDHAAVAPAVPKSAETITHAAFSSSLDLVAVATSTGSCAVFQRHSGERIAGIRIGQIPVRNIGFCRDETAVVTTELGSWAPLHGTISDPPLRLLCGEALSPNMALLAAPGDEPSTIVVVDAGTCTSQCTGDARHDEAVRACGWNVASTLLATGDARGNVFLWDVDAEVLESVYDEEEEEAEEEEVVESRVDAAVVSQVADESTPEPPSPSAALEPPTEPHIPPLPTTAMMSEPQVHDDDKERGYEEQRHEEEERAAETEAREQEDTVDDESSTLEQRIAEYPYRIFLSRAPMCEPDELDDDMYDVQVAPVGSSSRLARTVAILSSLPAHDGILAPTAVTLTPTELRVAFPCHEGSILQECDLLREDADSDEDLSQRILKLFSPVSKALAHCHAHQVEHRRIGRSSVVVRGGVAAVTDFSAASMATMRQLATEDADGANDEEESEFVRYQAPEWTDDSLFVPSARSDVYAVGALLFEALTGEPFTKPPDTSRIENADIRKMLDSMLHEDPNVRITSHGFAVALSDILDPIDHLLESLGDVDIDDF